MPTWREATIGLDRIDRSDRSLAITTRGAIDVLAAHIGNFGLLSPPLLREREGRFGIVAGFRRIDACHFLGLQRIAARVTDAPERMCVESAIADNTGERELNWIETGRAYALLRRHCADDGELIERAKALGLPAGSDVLCRVAELVLLPEQLQQWLLDDVLSLSMALELGRLSPGDALAIGKLFVQLRLGLNKQRELLGYLQEIAGRDHCGISGLLADREIVAILEDTRIDPPRKACLIRNVFRKCRYPQISEFEERYRKQLAGLRLPKGVSLMPPEHFEGSIWRWGVDFGNIAELGEKLEALRKLCDHPAFREMLE